MDRMSRRVAGVVLPLCLLPIVSCASSSSSSAGETTISADLPSLLREGRLGLANRTAEIIDEPGVAGVRIDGSPGDGLAWINGVAFSGGRIELRLRGRNLPGQSFVGVAFNGVDDQTYEAVYLRPFNFRAETPLQRGHAVQYIAHPSYTWNRLRQERPEEFENPVEPPPDPDAWVDLRVEVDPAAVRVFVGEGSDPDLTVERLAERSGTRIGLWVGNNSAGEFADVRVTPRRAPDGP